MKKFLVLLAVLAPLVLSAQKSPVDRLFDKYANLDGFTTINISGKLMSLAAKMDKSDPEAHKVFSSISGIRILSVEDSMKSGKPDFFDELDKAGFFKSNTYETLMEITEKDEVVRFFSKDAGNGKISELLLVIGGDNSTLISIRGLIDPENIGKITESIKIE